MEVAPHTIAVWSDIGCPWAHVAVHRLHTARARLGLDGVISFVHHPFPLELINERPTPKNVLDAEIPVAGGIEPGAGWQTWQAPQWHWPATILPALEAVQAAYEQRPVAGEQLDRALRVAFFRESRCIALRSVILDVASRCDTVDVVELTAALDDGRARAGVLRSYETATGDEVQGSPHLFLPDGASAHNPGMELRWEGKPGTGFPIVTSNDPSVYDDLLHRAAT